MFSSYYAWSGRRDPLNHCALNVALYGRGGKRWAMTERGRTAVSREAGTLAIGPSSVRLEDDRFIIDIDETTSPLPRRLKGRVELRIEGTTQRTFNLDANGCHTWWPIAPRVSASVTLEHPALSWTGYGYIDQNAGTQPLETDFKRWNWSYARLKGRSVVLYDVERRAGPGCAHALSIRDDGSVTEIDVPTLAPLRPTALWRMPRLTRADAPGEAVVLTTLEDTPFYSRSTLATRVLGEVTAGMHESLCLDRLTLPVVRGLLPFRNPRALWN